MSNPKELERQIKILNKRLSEKPKKKDYTAASISLTFGLASIILLFSFYNTASDIFLKIIPTLFFSIFALICLKLGSKLLIEGYER